MRQNIKRWHGKNKSIHKGFGGIVPNEKLRLFRISDCGCRNVFEAQSRSVHMASRQFMRCLRLVGVQLATARLPADIAVFGNHHRAAVCSLRCAKVLWIGAAQYPLPNGVRRGTGCVRKRRVDS